MKRITCLFILFIFFFSNVFGQGSGTWTTLTQMNCYKGISYSVVNMGFSNNAGGYLWGIKFRNDYQEPVTFSYKLLVGQDDNADNGFDVTRRLQPGEIWTDGADLFTAKLFQSSSANCFIKMKNVCFGNKTCNSNCFAQCDAVPAKPNQPPCGNNNSSSQSNNGNLNGDYVNEYDQTTKISMASGGINVEFAGSTTFYKQTSADTYLSDQTQTNGYEMYIEFPDNNEFKTWNKYNGKLSDTYVYKRKSSKQDNENSSSQQNQNLENDTQSSDQENTIPVESGTWMNMGSKASIEVTDGGLLYHIINSVDNGTQFYKRISANEYKWFDPDGVHYCLLKVKSSDKIDYSCNGLYFGEYNYFGSDKTNEDISAMNGEWKSDNGQYTVVTKTNGSGFDAWNKSDPSNKVYYNRNTSGEFTYTSVYGTTMILKMINNNRLESIQNGQHFDYFSRVGTSGNDNQINQQNKQQEKNDTSPDTDEWVSDYGNKATIKIDAEGMHWIEKDHTYLYKNMGYNTYRFGTDQVNSVVSFINNNRFSETFSSSSSVSYYTRSSAAPNQHKGFVIMTPMEADAKELADYNCKIFQLQKKTESNPSDQKSKQEMEKLSIKANDLMAEIEKRYTSKTDQDSFKKLFNSEMDKCK